MACILRSILGLVQAWLPTRVGLQTDGPVHGGSIPNIGTIRQHNFDVTQSICDNDDEHPSTWIPEGPKAGLGTGITA